MVIILYNYLLHILCAVDDEVDIPSVSFHVSSIYLPWREWHTYNNLMKITGDSPTCNVPR